MTLDSHACNHFRPTGLRRAAPSCRRILDIAVKDTDLPEHRQR